MSATLCLAIVALGSIAMVSNNTADEPAGDNASRAELKALEGVWRATERSLHGKEMPKKELQDVTLEIQGDQARHGGSTAKGEYKITIDPAKKPKSIDFAGALKDGKKYVLRGVYELDGNKLKLCWGITREAKRPDRIESGEGLFMSVFERVKQ